MHSRNRHKHARLGNREGFTLVEVLIASMVMAIGLTSAAFCLQFGLSNLDAARSTTAISQALQDEAERLRLENWAAISALPEEATLFDPVPAQFADTPFAKMVAGGRASVTRTVTNVAGFSDMKQITLRGAWTDSGGAHERVLHFRYAKGGVADYYYGTRS